MIITHFVSPLAVSTLAVMDNAGVNILMECSYGHSFISLGYLYLGLKLVGSVITLCLNFLRNRRLFFKKGVPFEIQFSNVGKYILTLNPLTLA